MIDKIKVYLGWVYAGIVLILGGLIFYLKASLDGAKSKLAQSQAEAKLGNDMAKLQLAEKEAENEEEEYRRTRDAFVKHITKRDDE